MKSVFDRFQLYWANQHETMEDDLANERIRPLHKIQIPLLQQVISYVHAFALRKIVQQKARVQVVDGAPFQPPLPCDCSTPIYMGIPCWHILFEICELVEWFFYLISTPTGITIAGMLT